MLFPITMYPIDKPAVKAAIWRAEEEMTTINRAAIQRLVTKAMQLLV